mmetsp:Transcript_12653/g.28090  ORF Transcript_12653/g.28090 Transcript_12653/m.28090 type:complete len:117 (-) Transcript_12653:586-936(-)
MREQLERWEEQFSDLFKVVFCVGSRWTNVHWGANAKDYSPPPVPEGFAGLKHKEMGWVNEDRIIQHGCPPSEDTKVLVCGLPGVYEKLCGPRAVPQIAANSVLDKLGYTESMVIKL